MLDEGEKEGKCGRQEDQKGERGWSTGEGGKGEKEEKTEKETQRKNSYLPMAYGFVHLNPLAH